MTHAERGELGIAEAQLEAALSEYTDDLAGLAAALDVYAESLGDDAPHAVADASKVVRAIQMAHQERDELDAAHMVTHELKHAGAAAVCIDFLSRHGNTYIAQFESRLCQIPAQGFDEKHAKWFRERVLPRLEAMRESRAGQETTDTEKLQFEVPARYNVDLTDETEMENAACTDQLQTLRMFGLESVGVAEWDTGEEQGLSITAEMEAGGKAMVTIGLDDDGSKDVRAYIDQGPVSEWVDFPPQLIHPDIWNALKEIATTKPV